MFYLDVLKTRRIRIILQKMIKQFDRLFVRFHGLWTQFLCLIPMHKYYGSLVQKQSNQLLFIDRFPLPNSFTEGNMLMREIGCFFVFDFIEVRKHSVSDTHCCSRSLNSLTYKASHAVLSTESLSARRAMNSPLVGFSPGRATTQPNVLFRLSTRPRFQATSMA